MKEGEGGSGAAAPQTVSGVPSDMLAYARELTTADYNLGQTVLYGLAPALRTLFESVGTVNLEPRPTPWAQETDLPNTVVNHLNAAITGDSWVGTVGLALSKAAQRGMGPYVFGHETSVVTLPSLRLGDPGFDGRTPEGRLDLFIKGSEFQARKLGHEVPPLQATGNRWDYGAAQDAWKGQCPPNGYGVIMGPDGRAYVVAVPGKGPASTGPSVGPMGDTIRDDGPGSGWSTVGMRQGDIAFGRPLDFSSRVAFAIAGTAGAGKPLPGPRSIGPNQSHYVTVSPEGYVTLNDGTRPPAGEFGKPPQKAQGPLAPPPEWTDQTRTGQRVERAQGGLDLVIGGLEGLNNAQQAENNRHYVSQIVFQENVDGRRRAVINLYQVMADGKQVFVKSSHGVINPDGTVSPAR